MTRTNFRRRGSYTLVESTISSESLAGVVQEIELSEQLNSYAPADAKYSSIETAAELPANGHRGSTGLESQRYQPELPAYAKYSSAYVPVNPEPLENAHKSTRPGNGWWQGQMLVDRSLRVLAATIVCLAIIMILTCIALAPKFNKRIGWHSSTTSIPIFSGSEAKMKNLSEVIKFFINIAATVILSASNTYQQILTSMKIEDLRYVLTHFGDTRVGTNSPFAIKHKKSGRAKTWCAWIFLVATSMPVHLLANSVVGVAYYPETIIYEQRNLTPENVVFDSHSVYSRIWNSEWIEFRLGLKANINDIRDITSNTFGLNDWGNVGYCGDINETALSITPNPFTGPKAGCSFTTKHVYYNEEACGALFGQLNNFQEADLEFGESEFGMPCTDTSTCAQQKLKDQCTISSIGFIRDVYNVETQCGEHKVVVRLLAAIILAICVSAKAIYMVVANVRYRYKAKSHCLTFGDVIVAAILEDIRIPSECLVNGGDFYRRTVAHTCHKHCKKDLPPSATGDEIGHCQKCKKFNAINNMPNLPWPTLATKSKKSLIANFGLTAVTQILTLSFTTTAMLVLSVMVGLSVKTTYEIAFCAGWITFPKASMRPMWLAQFGGNNSGLGAEISAFAMSNGAQLIYSMLYLLLLYNISLICMEHEWGNFEKGRRKLRCTIVKSDSFAQSYMLQMPARIMFPIVAYSTVMHWLLGLAIYAEETVVVGAWRQDSIYQVVTVPSAIWGSCGLMLGMTVACWWGFTYSREGYIPQMFGSIRAVCSAVSELNEFPIEGIMWGDLTGKPPAEMKGAWRHAGLSAGPVETVIPNELYAGRSGEPHKFDKPCDALVLKVL